LSIPI